MRYVVTKSLAQPESSNCEKSEIQTFVKGGDATPYKRAEALTVVVIKGESGRPLIPLTQRSDTPVARFHAEEWQSVAIGAKECRGNRYQQLCFVSRGAEEQVGCIDQLQLIRIGGVVVESLLSLPESCGRVGT